MDTPTIEEMQKPGAPLDGVDGHAEGGNHSVEYLADAAEQSLMDAASACAARNVPLKIRAALQVFNPEVKPYGAFKGWRGQAWTTIVAGVGEARRLQQVIELLFDLIKIGGIDRTEQALKQLKGNWTN